MKNSGMMKTPANEIYQMLIKSLIGAKTLAVVFVIITIFKQFRSFLLNEK